MINMSNPKDDGGTPPDKSGTLMQGCNGLVDGPEPSFQG